MAILTTGLLLVLVISVLRKNADERLCAVIAAQVGASYKIAEPGDPGYDYWRQHPMEQEAIFDRTEKFLDELRPLCAVPARPKDTGE